MTDELAEQVAQARRALQDCANIVVFSGAGMSAESGVPTFRDAQTGLWERYSPEELATEEAYRTTPDLVWSWLRWMGRLINALEPNPGHVAIGQAQTRWHHAGGDFDVVTQNMDNLHERAGATVASHLHGSLFSFRCMECRHRLDYELGRTTDDELAADAGLEDLLLETPPACPYCPSGFIRPDIVLFGEMLPEADFDAAVSTLEAADAVISVGTSSLVYPAASLPLLTADHGGLIIEVNPQPTPLSYHADFQLADTAATVLPELLA